MSGADALKLVAESADRAAAAGLAWRTDELLLRPAERLVTLIKPSQEIAESGEPG